MTLLERFREHLCHLDLRGASALVAVSGGPDSVTLLDLLARTRSDHQLALVVGHVDHGIQEGTAAVADRVVEIAAGYRLHSEVGRLALGPGTGETIARTRRYEWLEAARARLNLNYIITAHHADDQVETVLMRMLAGSGVAGLAAMAPVQGNLLRPLLPFRRVEILQHLRAAGLSAWVDPANSDSRHQRSWIRTELLPDLRRRMPDVDSKLLRLSEDAAVDRSAWRSVLRLLPELDLRSDGNAISIAAAPIGGYDSALKQAIVRALAREAGCTLGPARLGRVLQLLERGASGARVPLGGEWAAELAFDRLGIYRVQLPPTPQQCLLDTASGAGRWGRWRFRWELATVPSRQERAGLSAWFTPASAPLTVRAWVPGEKLRPLGGVGRRLVVRCFQEQRVPRSRRESWPVLAQSDKLVWIPGVCRSDLRVPAAGAQALRIDAEYA